MSLGLSSSEQLALNIHLTMTHNIDRSNWREAILDIWRIHSGRTPTVLDINNLRLLLDAPETFIRERLANPTNHWPPPPPAPPQASGACKHPPIIDRASCLRLFEVSQRADEVAVPRNSQPATPQGSNFNNRWQPLDAAPPRASHTGIYAESNSQVPHTSRQTAEEDAIDRFVRGSLLIAQPPNDASNANWQGFDRQVVPRNLPLRLNFERSEPAPVSGPSREGTTTEVLSRLSRQPRWGPSDIPLPEPTVAAVKNDVHYRRQHGCSAMTHPPGSTEGYPCTLGCGRWLTSSCDRRRHEENVFPQEYWVCYTCSPGSTSRRQFQFFHRRDKIQKHNREVHDGQLDIDHCKVRDPPVLTPAFCGLCQYGFADPADRDHHIDKSHAGRRPQVQPLGSVIGSLRQVQPQHVGNGHAGDMDDADAPTAFLQQQAVPFTTVVIHRFVPSSANQPRTPTEHTIAIQWLGEAVFKCGVATSLKASIAFDMRQGRYAEPREYIVKQYSHQHRTLFEQEVKMYSEVSRRYESDALTRPFGSFQSADHQGRPTYNILLECSCSSLWDYWKQRDPPRSYAAIQSFYTELFKLASALETLQRLRELPGHDLDCILRVDFRPEKIHSVPQERVGPADRFKLDLRYQPGSAFRFDDRPGRRAWRRALIVVAWFGCNSKLNLICTTASTEREQGKQICICIILKLTSPDDVHAFRHMQNRGIDQPLEKVRRAEILSIGCILSLAATWMTMGRAGLQALEMNPLPQLQHEPAAQDSAHLCPIDVASVPAVPSWHRKLTRWISAQDTVTHHLLQLLDQYLFKPRTAHHIHSSALKANLDEILERSIQDGNWLGLNNQASANFHPTTTA